ncbi:MAG: hypothetical protein IJL93_08655 [Bacteroidales bacterium]|nr:hypothetical protein [Bacteroidales bacterium]
MEPAAKAVKFTPVSVLHYIRLIYRSAIFVVLTALYVIYRVKGGADIEQRIESRPVLLVAIWAVFVLEMVLRFFPSRLESPGCQKQFGRNFIKSGQTDIRIEDNNATFLVALAWIAFNMIFGALHMMGVLDDGIMLLLCSLYSVCDMVCILIFCPFETWFLKNRCCSTCRIYNWDYAMMFTPLFFVEKSYTWSLLALSIALLIRWEVTFYRHPERFSPATNRYLSCRNCSEKLCAHKVQLRRLWRQVAQFNRKRLARLHS